MKRGQDKQVFCEEIEETRQAILRTAEQLFMEYGYRAVSTRRIAAACGLTQPALYHYFADKQALYVAVIYDTIIHTRNGLERIARRSDSVLERLHAVVRYLHSHIRPDMSMMFHDVRQELDEQAQGRLRELFHNGLIMPIATIFADGISQGLLRREIDAITATYLLMGLLTPFMKKNSALAGTVSTARPIGSAEDVVEVLLYGLVEQCPSKKQSCE
jgi:AcrR family transcriptional regulator